MTDQTTEQAQHGLRCLTAPCAACAAEKDALMWPEDEGPRAHDSWACNGGGAWHWHPASVQDCPIPAAARCACPLNECHDAGAVGCYFGMSLPHGSLTRAEVDAMFGRRALRRINELSNPPGKG